jgi:RNA polymerase sigma-70 factor (ECF subfamily)
MFSIDDDERTFELPDTEAPNPENEAIKKEERDQVHIILQSLDATDRAAIIMRYWYDFSEAEIAEALNLTVSAVKSRLHRARRALANLWQDPSVHTRAERMPYGTPAF